MAWLEWISSLIGAGPRQALTAALPQDRFHCLLDELPLHLIPRRRFPLRATGDLFPNPYCSVCSRGKAPEELDAHRDLLENFHWNATTAWVRDSATGALSPFWLGPRLEAAVASLHPGVAVPDSLPEDVRQVLAAAEILTPVGHAERRVAQWNAIVSRGAEHFRSKAYVPLGNLIHPFNLAALRRYYRYAIRRGNIRLGDEQSARRYVAHNDSVARFFHHQITNKIAAIAGEAIKPSYVYLASYLSGAELKKHTDREQCEFSVTLCLDFSPEPELATPWPICLDTTQGTVVGYQALGDGLVYRGTKVPHYRKPLPEGHTSTSMFFHYVPVGFAGPLN